MANTETILSQLKSIGTFLQRVDAMAALPPASAGIPAIAESHGFSSGYQGKDFSVLASADGCSIVFGQQEGYWLLKGTDSKTYLGQGADQLQFQLKRVGMNAGGAASEVEDETKTPGDARFTKDSSEGAKAKPYDTYTHPAGHKLTVAPSGNWKMRLATGKKVSSKDPSTPSPLGNYLNSNHAFFKDAELDKK